MEASEGQDVLGIRACDGASRLEILSSIAKVDSLKDITSLEILSSRETIVIELLNHYSKLSGDTIETAQAARAIIVECRQSQLHKSGKSDLQSSSPFDRLIYLLDRYLDYCTSINLSAWPIDHLKVSIWIKNDVTLTTNSTRMKPLRKTVRCYVTSLESIRIKTLHLFKGIHLAVHLMKSKIILEILNTLSVERDNLEERLGINQAPADTVLVGSETKNQRDLLLDDLRSRSGDELSNQAIAIVKASRAGEQAENGCRTRCKAADPHIHTLLRYRNYCFLNQIPMWPIDALKVGLWLQESVLVGDPRSKNKKPTVSFRTVQVYISRLEYARSKTEHLFQEFPNCGGSLYKCKEVINILSRLHNPKKPHSTATETETDELIATTPTPSEDCAESPPGCNEIIRTLPTRTGLPSHLETLPTLYHNHSKKRKLSGRNFSPRKLIKSDIENSAALKLPELGKVVSVQPRFALRDSNGRRTPSLRLQRDDCKLVEFANVATANLATPTRRNLQIPSISEWYSPSPSPVRKTKGCISFILCSDGDSDQGSNSASSCEAMTPLASPIPCFDRSKQVPGLSPSSLLDSPTCNRFWCFSLSGVSQHEPSRV